MSVVRWDEPGTVYRGQTDRVLEFAFLHQDGTVQDLTGCNGFVTFWYSGAAVHLTRQAQVDATNGIVRYFPQGDEFPTVGDVCFQATAMKMDDPVGVDRLQQTFSHGIVRRRVVETP